MDILFLKVNNFVKMKTSKNMESLYFHFHKSITHDQECFEVHCDWPTVINGASSRFKTKLIIQLSNIYLAQIAWKKNS